MKNRNRVFFVIAFMVLSNSVVAQYHDANWVLSTGYDSINNNSLIYFPSGGQPPQVSLVSGYIPFNYTNANISDQHGNLLFITNGINVYNSLYQPIPGCILQTPYVTLYATQGLNRTHQFIFLPWPDDTNKYVLFYCVPELPLVTSGPCANGWTWLSTHLYYTVLDKTLNGGLGGIVSASNIALTDTLIALTGLAAVKHANGRDWWLVVKENCNNSYKKVLFTPNGVQYAGVQSIGPTMNVNDGAVSNFSPDGNTYFQVKSDYDLHFYKFDRCTGLFSDPLSITSSVAEFYSAFSPDSRFLYRDAGSQGINTAQYDLNLYNQPGSVQSSRKLINPPFDTNACATIQTSGSVSAACAPELAPNGKIYFGHCYLCNLSVINFPDSLDTLCQMEYNSFVLPSPHVGLPPYFPNYRLGPVSGSNCDTLSVGVNEIQHDFQFNISPNPTTNGEVKMSYNLPMNQSGELNIYNITGELILNLILHANSRTQHLNVSLFSEGIYSCVLTSQIYRATKKFVVIVAK